MIRSCASFNAGHVAFTSFTIQVSAMNMYSFRSISGYDDYVAKQKNKGIFTFDKHSAPNSVAIGPPPAHIPWIGRESKTRAADQRKKENHNIEKATKMLDSVLIILEQDHFQEEVRKIKEVIGAISR